MTENSSQQSDAFEYDQWRSQFLNVVLRVSCGLGIFLIGAIITSATSVELGIFGAIYLFLIVVTFTPISYEIKSGSFLAVGYFIGLYTLMRFGPWSDAVIFFLSVNLFASLLFDKQVDKWVFFINTTTIASIGVLNTLNIFTLSSPNPLPPTDLFDWITYITDYVVITITLVWAINLLKKEFGSIVDKFQSTLQLLSKHRDELEKLVEERTTGLVKKTDQLRAASYIARQIADTENVSSLLNMVVNLITNQFGYYHAGIFLLNDTGETATLQAASSPGGKRMLENGHVVDVGKQGIVGQVALHKTPRIALDIGTDAVFFNNPDLPATRSEIALPLITRNKTLGVLDIQSDQSQVFSSDDIDVLQTLADQITVAIENIRLLDETQAMLAQLETVTAIQTREAWRQKNQKNSPAFTYTPLGLRAEAFPGDEEKALNIPIPLRGQKIGVISIAHKNNDSWNKIDQDLITEVAYQVGLAVENIRLLENTTLRAQQEKTVGELAARFSQSLDIDGLLQTAARALGQVADVSDVSVFIGQIPEQVSQKRRSKRTTS